MVSKKHQTEDGIAVKLFFLVIVLVIPALGYYVLKPTQAVREQNIEQTRQFAKFIETNPNMLHQNDAQNNLQAPAVQEGASKQESSAGISDLNTTERATIYELNNEWKQVGFVKDQHWRDQVEYLFSVAQRSKDPNVLDILRVQIIEGKNDKNQENQLIARQSWYDRYYKLETRPEFKKQIEESFQQTRNDGDEENPNL